MKQCGKFREISGFLNFRKSCWRCWDISENFWLLVGERYARVLVKVNPLFLELLLGEVLVEAGLLVVNLDCRSNAVSEDHQCTKRIKRRALDNTG